MKLYAQVSLDLIKATTEQRSKFYEVLIKEKWKKVDSISTTWEMTFSDDVSPDSAMRVIKSDLRMAEKAAGVSYDASVSIGYKPIRITSSNNLSASL